MTIEQENGSALADGHLRDEMLVRLALGEIPATSGDLGEHLADCADCRGELLAVRGMRSTLLANEMSAPPALLARVQDAIAATQDVDSARALPSRVQPLRGWRTWAVVGASVAAALTIAVMRSGQRSSSRGPAVEEAVADREGGDSQRSAPARDDLPSALSLWPSIAHAAGSADQELPYDAIVSVTPQMIVPGTRHFVRSAASSYSEMKPKDAFTIRVDSARLMGEPVWRIVHIRSSSPFSDSFADTTWIGRGDLRLRQYWKDVGGIMSVRYRLQGDSLLFSRHALPASFPQRLIGRIREAEQRGEAIDRERRLVMSMPAFLVLLRALPLHATWRGSIIVQHQVADSLRPPSVRPSDAPRREHIPLNVSVQGDSVVNTLWGRIPAWRVVLHTGRNPERWYVSKRTGEVILMTGPEAMNWPRTRIDLISRYSEEGMPQ